MMLVKAGSRTDALAHKSTTSLQLFLDDASKSRQLDQCALARKLLQRLVNATRDDIAMQSQHNQSQTVQRNQQATMHCLQI